MTPTTSLQPADLVKNAVIFGHKTTRWNPKMKKYIYGVKNGVHVFDVDKTIAHLENAMEFITAASSAGKVFLIVGTKPQLSKKIKDFAEKTGMFFINKKWVGGLLTNFVTLKSRLKSLKTVKEQEETGEINKYTKKEQSKLLKEMKKLEDILGGVQNLLKLPDVIIVFDIHHERLAIKEAQGIGIPVIGIGDSNANPDGIEYLIPANDDSTKSIDFLLAKIEAAYRPSKQA